MGKFTNLQNNQNLFNTMRANLQIFHVTKVYENLDKFTNILCNHFFLKKYSQKPRNF